MIKKYEFIEKTLFLIKKLLEENLPDEDTLGEMKDKTDNLLKEFIR